jgi:hypothetical protein
VSTSDVHYMIDNKLPEGKTCTAVSMYLVYTATIDGNDVTVSVEPDLREEDIAIRIVAELGTPDNAVAEGEDVPDDEHIDTKAVAAQEDEPEDYDDGADQLEEGRPSDFDYPPPKAKSKTKKKK